jgi:hypothetical protein
MATKKKKTANSEPGSEVHLLHRILVVEHLVEMLFAHEFTHLTKEHADLTMKTVYDQFLLKGADKAMDELLLLLLGRIAKRADLTRPPGGPVATMQ